MFCHIDLSFGEPQNIVIAKIIYTSPKNQFSPGWVWYFPTEMQTPPFSLHTSFFSGSVSVRVWRKAKSAMQSSTLPEITKISKSPPSDFQNSKPPDSIILIFNVFKFTEQKLQQRNPLSPQVNDSSAMFTEQLCDAICMQSIFFFMLTQGHRYISNCQDGFSLPILCGWYPCDHLEGLVEIHWAPQSVHHK